MDPDETLKLLIDAAVAGDTDSMLGRASDLDDWLSQGGFAPRNPLPALCDGCEATDRLVVASDDGRAQFCRQCVPVLHG